MRIFHRPSAQNQTPHVHWPLGFENFITRRSSATPLQFACASASENTVTMPHGRCGASVVCTQGDLLRDAWRVAAFHSDIVCELNAFDSDNLSRGDGIVVEGPHFKAPLAISTADCLAMAVTYETPSGVQLASCFHAGWRGYTAGIQQQALKWMKEKLAQQGALTENWLQHLHVTIGPAVAGISYPCGEDVLSALMSHREQRLLTLPDWSAEHNEVFGAAIHCRSETIPDLSSSRAQKIYPDLQALLIIELTAWGLSPDQVSVLREDTFTSSWWPSHRRAMAQGLQRAGRLVTHLCPPACP